MNLFGQVEMAAHMELALFVVTVFSIPLLVRALCPGRRVRGSWAVFFLFPGLYLYDSSLGAAADHVLAFWAVPLALALRRMAQRPSPATGALVGAIMAGAAMTKYQAVYVLVPAALFVSFIAGRELWRTRRDPTRAGAVGLRRAILAPPVVLALVALVASAPHWLANVVWHGNPVYPMLLHVFPSHPLVPGWVSPTVSSATFDPGWQPTGPLFSRLGETLVQRSRSASSSTISRCFTGMFRCSVSCSRSPGRCCCWCAAVVASCRRSRVARCSRSSSGTGRSTRIGYLQAILPWMVATTAAALVLAWQAGRPRARASCCWWRCRSCGRRPLAARQRDDA